MWHVVLLWSYAVFENCTLPSSLLSTARASAPITTTTMIATTAAISRRGGPFRAGAAGAGQPHAGGGAPYGESGTPMPEAERHKGAVAERHMGKRARPMPEAERHM